MGIKYPSHLTFESRAHIVDADRLLYLVNCSVMEHWLSQCNPKSESLKKIYSAESHRPTIYQKITDYVLSDLKKGGNLCLVFYGHPTILVNSGLTAITRAKSQGYKTRVLPAISAEACLWADLCIDPASHGWQSFEATDFVLRRRPFSNQSHLVLWQPSIVGCASHSQQHDNTQGIALLKSLLLNQFPPEHSVIIYEAAQYPTFEPKIETIPLKDLEKADLSDICLLYLKPIEASTPHPNRNICTPG